VAQARARGVESVIVWADRFVCGRGPNQDKGLCVAGSDKPPARTTWK